MASRSCSSGSVGNGWPVARSTTCLKSTTTWRSAAASQIGVELCPDAPLGVFKSVVEVLGRNV